MKILVETDYKIFEAALEPLWDEQNVADGVDMAKEMWAFSARDESGHVVGGVGGYIKWNWLYVQHLIVDPDMRGKGLGQTLMRYAEDYARGKGVLGLHLRTLGSQARDFYLKCGFEVVGVIEGMPKGNSNITMAKRLR